MGALAGAARTVMRSLLLPPVTAACLGEFVLGRASHSLRDRIVWLQQAARRHAKWLGMHIRIHGAPPQSGLIVSNHVSYLDILALGAATPCTFVAKKEVADWPLFGLFAKLGSAIFVDRERRGAVAGVADEMRGHLDAGVPLVLFPEGTSTGHEEPLPFRSSLFEPVVALHCPVTACALRYTLDDGGSVPDEIAYWRDMAFGPHLLNLLGKRSITLDIHFGPSSLRNGDRKTLARDLHAEVCALLKG